MNSKTRWFPAIVGLLVVAGVAARAQETVTAVNQAATPDALKAEIEALRVPKVAWRQIVWKSCLLEGLKESRETNKPLILWVFIDRPTDDARC